MGLDYSKGYRTVTAYFGLQVTAHADDSRVPITLTIPPRREEQISSDYLERIMVVPPPIPEERRPTRKMSAVEIRSLDDLMRKR